MRKGGKEKECVDKGVRGKRDEKKGGCGRN